MELLIEGNESVAAEFGNVIDSYNQDRKSIDRHVTQEAHEYIEQNPALKKAPEKYGDLQSALDEGNRGDRGLAADRDLLPPDGGADDEQRIRDGFGAFGPGFDLYQAVESCSDLLENFGGHMYAAGLTMRPENVEEFTRRFNAFVEENIDPQMLIPQVDIDSELLFSGHHPGLPQGPEPFPALRARQHGPGSS